MKKIALVLLFLVALFGIVAVSVQASDALEPNITSAENATTVQLLGSNNFWEDAGHRVVFTTYVDSNTLYAEHYQCCSGLLESICDDFESFWVSYAQFTVFEAKGKLQIYDSIAKELKYFKFSAASVALDTESDPPTLIALPKGKENVFKNWKIIAKIPN